MCPVCFVTIGGGLLIARKFGVNQLFFVGLITILLSMLVDLLISKVSKGKHLFPFQKVVISAVILILVTVSSYFLL